MPQAGFFKGAVLASSVLLGAGFVAFRAGWVQFPEEPGGILDSLAGLSVRPPADDGILFDSSKSGRVFLPVGSTVVPPQTGVVTVPDLTMMGGSKTFVLTPTPTAPTVIMGGSKSITLPPQLATPPKK